MKKICYITTIGLTIKSFFIPQLRFLASHGYDVYVICSYEKGLKEELGSDIHYYPVEIPRGISFFKMIKAIKEIRKIVRMEKFDILQYSTPNAGFCGALAGKTERILVRNYHLMGLRYLGEKGIKRGILKCVEKITCFLSTDIECVSKSNLKLSIKEGLFKKGKGTVVYYGSSGGIDLSRFSYSMRKKFREEIRKKYKISDNTFIYGFVGRITRDKGVNELLNAYKKIDNSVLMMIGFMDEVNTLDQQLYNWSKKRKDVIYTGAVTDVEKYYAAIDCLVLPSYREGFGNVVIEAAAMGTPAIVTDIPGPIDTSLENKTALWIPPCDSEALEFAMKKMKSQAKIMEKKCVEYVSKFFDDQKLNVHILNRKNYLYKRNNVES